MLIGHFLYITEIHNMHGKHFWAKIVSELIVKKVQDGAQEIYQQS